jgi:glycogen operon protein
VEFSVVSGTAEKLTLCLFDEKGAAQTVRRDMERGEDGVWSCFVEGLEEGARYGYRADGRYDPLNGYFFDPAKLLVDPYALAVDRPYAYRERLASARGEGGDTAGLVPKAIVTAPRGRLFPRPPLFKPGGLIYEVPVRAFTKRHPAIHGPTRGTVEALRQPEIIEHLVKLGVGAVELMPVAAWIDERHLPPLNLRNAWGYNPVTFMALDPRLAPGGVAELRETVEALHEAGIGVILDVVLNHTGEADAAGPVLSLRGLDNLAYYRHSGSPPRLENATGCGNTLNADSPLVQKLVVDTLRHFVTHAGVDGFRFDLATVLGRTAEGFDSDAPLLRMLRENSVVCDRILIAEPWDIGEGGYQLGHFPPPFLEWNDRYRDDVRRFWRGAGGMAGPLATRLAGSFDIFQGAAVTRTVNFVAAHDGMTLADLVSYERKHNSANGEDNRDGHDENFSWNNGVEGKTTNAAIVGKRRHDCAALLATLFASRGAIMLTAGDEFGRSQHGNNNAYAQDNETTWLDWEGADKGLLSFVRALAALRREFGVLGGTSTLSGQAGGGSEFPDVAWLTEEGDPLSPESWQEDGRRAFTMMLREGEGAAARRLAVFINANDHPRAFTLPARAGCEWRRRAAFDASGSGTIAAGIIPAPARSVLFYAETPTGSAAKDAIDSHSANDPSAQTEEASTDE